MVYRSILVPLDGSPSAEHALASAAEIARLSGATLRLVHVHALSITPIYIEGHPVIDKNLAPLGLEHEQIYLEQLRTKLRKACPAITITVEVLNRSMENMMNESVGVFLARHVTATDVDLVVMTTHGRGGLARFWLGSVADMLVRLTNVPLLLLRPTATPPDFAHPPSIQRILIPLDGSALSEQILQPTLALGALLHAQYTLLRVVEPLYTEDSLIAYPEELDGETIQETQNYLDTLVPQLDTAAGTITTHVLLEPQPAVAILDYAQHHTTDLIAMATHGRSGIKRLLIGSTADKVLRGGQSAVLVLRPQEAHM